MQAPPMGAAFVRRRMQAELGADWRGRFSEVDLAPAAAASRAASDHTLHTMDRDPVINFIAHSLQMGRHHNHTSSLKIGVARLAENFPHQLGRAGVGGEAGILRL